MWCQLAALLAVVVGGALSTVWIGTILVVLAWLPALLIKNSFRSSSLVISHANEVINFQVFWLIILIPSAIVAVVVSAVTLGVALIVVIPVLLAIGIFQLVVMIIATVKASQGLTYRYPLVGFRVVHG
jgi:uncharacterized Tic20 family protein